MADDVEQELCKLGLTARQFRVESIIATAKWTGMPTPLIVDQSTGARLLLTRSDDSGWARLIDVRARRTVSKYGVANFVEIKAELAEVAGSFADPKIVAGIISAMPHYEALGQGWFWLREGSRNHMLTIVRKVFAVAPRIHISEMRAAIANDPRGMGFAPPKEVVARFCKSAVDCEVDDDFLIIRKPHLQRASLAITSLHCSIYFAPTDPSSGGGHREVVYRARYEPNHSGFISYPACNCGSVQPKHIWPARGDFLPNRPGAAPCSSTGSLL